MPAAASRDAPLGAIEVELRPLGKSSHTCHHRSHAESPIGGALDDVRYQRRKAPRCSGRHAQIQRSDVSAPTVSVSGGAKSTNGSPELGSFAPAVGGPVEDRWKARG